MVLFFSIATESFTLSVPLDAGIWCDGVHRFIQQDSIEHFGAQQFECGTGRFVSIATGFFSDGHYGQPEPQLLADGQHRFDARSTQGQPTLTIATLIPVTQKTSRVPLRHSIPTESHNQPNAGHQLAL
jgi:hypothetical protein